MLYLSNISWKCWCWQNTDDVYLSLTTSPALHVVTQLHFMMQSCPPGPGCVPPGSVDVGGWCLMSIGTDRVPWIPDNYIQFSQQCHELLPPRCHWGRVSSSGHEDALQHRVLRARLQQNNEIMCSEANISHIMWPAELHTHSSCLATRQQDSRSPQTGTIPQWTRADETNKSWEHEHELFTRKSFSLLMNRKRRNWKNISNKWMSDSEQLQWWQEIRWLSAEEKS